MLGHAGQTVTLGAETDVLTLASVSAMHAQHFPGHGNQEISPAWGFRHGRNFLFIVAFRNLGFPPRLVAQMR